MTRQGKFAFLKKDEFEVCHAYIVYTIYKVQLVVTVKFQDGEVS